MKIGQDNGGLADNEITGLTVNLDKLKKVCIHSSVPIYLVITCTCAINDYVWKYIYIHTIYIRIVYFDEQKVDNLLKIPTVGVTKQFKHFLVMVTAFVKSLY